MEEDSSTETAQRRFRRQTLALALWVAGILLVSNLLGSTDPPGTPEPQGLLAALQADTPEPGPNTPWTEILPPAKIAATLVLLGLSAFFSASEIAFFSLHSLRLRVMRASSHPLEQLGARLMDHPGNLLTSILMANSIVNVMLSVVLAAPVEQLILHKLEVPTAVSYILALVICTGVLVLFGEVFPKVMVVRIGERFVRLAAVPVYLADRMLTPLRNGLLLFIGFFFRITGFSRVRPAPFITDEEFKSLLSESEAQGVIEKGEREMIQGIIESSDVTVREILIPRPDMVAIKETATVEEALALFREQEYSRMPIYSDGLDHITGILYAKDLLPLADQGEVHLEIKPLARRVHFVPETMTVAKFVKTVQRLRSHMAIVVDEFGGTEGLVTLQDALREVIGDFVEEGEEDEPMITEIEPRLYRVDGGLPVYELEELTGIPVNDTEHTTVAGFVMDLIERIPEEGDQIEHLGVLYTVEQVEGKRIAKLRIQVPEPLIEEVET